MPITVGLSTVSISKSYLQDNFEAIDVDGNNKLDAKEMALWARKLTTDKANKMKESEAAKKDLGKLLFAGSGGPMAALLPALLGNGSDNPLLIDTDESDSLKADADAYDKQIAFFTQMAVGGTGGNGLTETIRAGGIQYDDIATIAGKSSDGRTDTINTSDLSTYTGYNTLSNASFTSGDDISEKLRTTAGATTTSGAGDDKLLSLLKPLLGPMGAILDLIGGKKKSVVDIDSADAGKPDILTTLLPLLLAQSQPQQSFGGGFPQQQQQPGGIPPELLSLLGQQG